MTRYAIDADVMLRLLAEHVRVFDGHSLVAPVLLKSQVLASLYRQVRSGGLPEAEAKRRLTAFAETRIRLLGDRMSRSTAWRIATEHDCVGTSAAEYVAVASLQADALIALDPEVAALAAGVVPLAPFEALTRP